MMPYTRGVLVVCCPAGFSSHAAEPSARAGKPPAQVFGFQAAQPSRSTNCSIHAFGTVSRASPPGEDHHHRLQTHRSAMNSPAIGIDLGTTYRWVLQAGGCDRRGVGRLMSCAWRRAALLPPPASRPPTVAIS